MADRDNKKPQTDDSLQSQLKGLALEISKVLGKVAWRVTRWAGKGTLMAYRAVGQRRANENRDAELASRDVEDSLNRAGGVRQRFGRKQPAEQRFVERTAQSDAEAASLLEDFLQETARDLQQQPQVESAPIAVEKPAEADMEVEDTTMTVEDPPAAVQDGLPQAEVQAPQPKPVTYNTEAEQDRIREQLHQRETLLQQEEEQRKTVYEEKERQQRDKQAQMKADLERIRQEKREKEAAFQRAEAERKQRETERQQNVNDARNRLTDDAPRQDRSAAGDATPDQATDEA